MSKQKTKKLMAIVWYCFICLFSKAQTDTIFKFDGKKIPCVITLVNEGAVFFKDKNGFGDQVEIKNISKYRKDGILFFPKVPSEVPLDTSYNALFINDVNINKLDIKFCELINLDFRSHGGTTYIYIDYGQKIENPQKIIIRNNKWKVQYFNSMIDALNFMDKNGWEYVDQSVVLGMSGIQGALIYKILLKRKQ